MKSIPKFVMLYVKSIRTYFPGVPVIGVPEGGFVVLDVSSPQFKTENFPAGIGDVNKRIVARLNVIGDMAVV